MLRVVFFVVQVFFITLLAIDFGHLCQCTIRVSFHVQVTRNISIVEDNYASLAGPIRFLKAPLLHTTSTRSRAIDDLFCSCFDGHTAEHIVKVVRSSRVKNPYFDTAHCLVHIFIFQAQNGAQVHQCADTQTYDKTATTAFSGLHGPYKVFAGLGQVCIARDGLDLMLDEVAPQ
jgi:hypothetical protein